MDKIKSLIIILFINIVAFNNSIAQQNNKAGVGYNLSFTNGYSAHFLGLKIYYEKEVFNNFSLKGNIDLLLPNELTQIPIETSLLYNISLKSSKKQIFIGLGVSYCFLSDNSTHHYYYENSTTVNYIPFEESVFGFNIISGINELSENISLEIKYIFLSVDQKETLYFQDQGMDLQKRIKNINLNTLRFSLSYYFEF